MSADQQVRTYTYPEEPYCLMCGHRTAEAGRERRVLLEHLRAQQGGEVQ